MPRTVGSLQTKISLDDAQFQNSMAGINRQLRSLRQETRAVTSSGTGFARGVDEMRAKADVLTRTLKVQDAQVKELRRAYEEARAKTGENSKETQEAAEAYNRARAQMNRTESQLKFLTEEVERQTNPWNRLSDIVDATGRGIQTLGRGMTSVGRTLTTRVTLPVLGLGAGILKTGMDFEEGMSQVQALTRATAEDMLRLEGQARELGESTRFSATEAADAMGFLGMAGFNTAQIMDTMPGLLDLAASANMDLGRAADIATNILSGFNMEAAEAGRVADILAAGASSSNTNVEQLGEAMKYVAPVAASMNLEIEGLTASVGLLSDAGIQGSQAGRQLRQGLLRLANPTGKAAELIEELGIKAFDADGNMKEMHEVVAELEKGLKDMDAQARASALAIVFGSESTAGWSRLLEEGSGTLREYTRELENSEGAAKEMAAIMQDNAKGAMIEFKSATEGIAISLAEHMLPVVTDLIHQGTELVRKFGELDDSQQQNIIKAGMLAAALGPVSIVMGHVATSIGGLIRGGGQLIRLIGGSGGLIASLGSLAGPAGIALVAAAGIGFLAYKINKTRKESEELHDVSTESAKSLLEQANSIEELANEYEELEMRSRLTAEEFGRLVDISEELNQTIDPGTVSQLEKEYEELASKSGLSNEELDKMIRLNNDIIEQAPGVEKTFTDKGNAIVESTNAVREYINALRDMSWVELEQERFKAMENEQRLLEENREIRRQIKELDEEWRVLQELGTLEEAERQEVLKQGLNDIRWEMRFNAETQEEINKLKEKEEILLAAIEDGLAAGVEKIQEQSDALKEKLDKNDLELQKLNEVEAIMADILLQEVGLNFEQGKGLEKLDKKIDKLIEERNKILENLTEEEKRSGVHNEIIGQLNSEIEKHELIKRQLYEELNIESKQSREEREQNRERDRALAKIKEMHGEQIYFNREATTSVNKARDLTRELGRDTRKRIRVDDGGSIRLLEQEARRPLTKRVTLRAAWSGVTSGLRQALSWLPGFASGTTHAPGGLAWVGEEGFELARYKDQWAFLDFGIANIPTGTEIFTHEQSKKIIRSLNNLPRYASGTGVDIRSITQTVEQDTSNDMIIRLLQTINRSIREGQKIVIDGRVLNEYVDEGLKSSAEIESYMMGRR